MRVQCCAAVAAATILLAVAPAGASPGALTPEHVAQHREQAAVARHERDRLASLSPAERERLAARREAVDARAAAVEPAEGGAWSAPFPHRSYAMHAALLPTGKVLFWSLPLNGYDEGVDNEGLAWLWDPALGSGPGAFVNADPPLVDSEGDGDLERAPIWCSGQSFLPDGRLLVTGGNRQWPDEGDAVGWEGVFTFNPWNQTWARQPDMADGRWYPSQVLTGEGETFIAAGYSADPSGGEANTMLERFLPDPDIDGGDGVLSVVGDPAGSTWGNYPHLFTLPSGHVAAAGPINSDVALLDTDTGQWDRLFDADRERPLMSQNRVGGTAVLRPAGPAGSDVVTNIGGWAFGGEASEHDPSVATTETLDFFPSSGGREWQFDAPLQIARANHNTVLLPDGGMVTVGGGSGRSDAMGVRAMYADGRTRAVELMDPGGGSWRLGAAQAEDRGYHSTALLLPDGRVMSAGDDIHPNSNGDTIEIYSPPYLFRGDRPAIAAAPAAVGYGQAFDVGSPSGGLARAVLMAPGATTHAADMTQRHVELQVLGPAAGGGLSVRAPARPDLAPPGYYMLFLLNDAGVPSVARWLRLDPAIDPGDPTDEEPPDEEPPTDEEPPADEEAPAPPLPAPPGDGPTPPPPPIERAPSAEPPRDGLAPTLRLRVTAASVRAALRTGRLRFTLSVDERAAVDALLRARGRSAGTLRTVLAAGTHRLSLRVRRRLLRARPLRLSVMARDDAGNVRRIGLTLRRPR